MKGKARQAELEENSNRSGADDRRHARFVSRPGRISDLALVIVDEQHRFGVHQRLGCVKKAIKAVIIRTN